MHRRWTIIVALFAVGCGQTFEAASEGKDATADALEVDSGRAEASADGSVGSDGGGPADAAADALDAAKDTGLEAAVDAGDWSPVCPEEQPAIGDACSTDKLQCEYPKPLYKDTIQYDVACDTVRTCMNGKWTDASITAMTCNPDVVNPGQCPSRFNQIMNGGSCSDDKLRCEYALGLCTCTENTGSVVVLVDAGSSWSCEPEMGCPVPRARLGSTCPTDGQSCTYEACAYAQTCGQGIWQGGEEACAQPGASP